MFALKSEQRGAPAVLEAVRQRCSHIAATKADQVFNVICSQGRLRDVHLPCGCLTCTATDARTLLLTQSLTCIAAVSCRIMPVKQFTYKRGGGGRSNMGGGWHNAHETWRDERVAKVHVQLFMPLFLQLVGKHAVVGPNLFTLLFLQLMLAYAGIAAADARGYLCRPERMRQS